MFLGGPGLHAAEKPVLVVVGKKRGNLDSDIPGPFFAGREERACPVDRSRV